MSSPERVTLEFLQARPLPWPDESSDKDARGIVLVAGASALSPGAASLSGVAALRAGAGKVQLAVPKSLALAIGIDFPEAGVHGFADTRGGDPVAVTAARQISAQLSTVDAALIGPGLADMRKAQDLVRRLLEAVTGPRFVIDALSLTGLWDSRRVLSRHRGKLVITPHAGEMAELTGLSKEEVCADPSRVASETAAHLGCIVVLKGASTVIAEPGGRLYLHEGGDVGLATSGSGDVLAGVLAGLMARGTDAVDAALWSVFLHAEAGRCLAEHMGPLGFLARELPGEIPQLMRRLAPAHR